jgi:hypothetical protein
VKPPTSTIDPETVVIDVECFDHDGRPANDSRKAFTNDETSEVDCYFDPTNTIRLSMSGINNRRQWVSTLIPR